MKKKQGFTLVELLGVFALLAIIALVSIPYATGMLRKENSKETARYQANIKLATEAYVQSKIDEYPELTNNYVKVYISFSELIESGFLKSNLVDPSTKKKVSDLNYSVSVQRNSSEKLEYKVESVDSSSKNYVKDKLIVLYDAYNQPITKNDQLLWKDSSGNGNDGIVNGSSWSSYMYFDGIEDYVDMGLQNYDFGQNVTFEALVKISGSASSSSRQIMGNWEGAGGGLYYTSNQIVFQIYNGSWINIGTSFDLSKWYDVVGTYNGTTLKLYINGTLKNSASASGNILKSSVPMIIGADPNLNGNAKFGQMEVSQIAIYTKALTVEEITQNYNVNKARYGWFGG